MIQRCHYNHYNYYNYYNYYNLQHDLEYLMS